MSLDRALCETLLTLCQSDNIIAAAYCDGGMTLREIADKTNQSEWSVRRTLERIGVDRRRVGAPVGPRHGGTNNQGRLDIMTEMRLAGSTLKEIGEKHGVT